MTFALILITTYFLCFTLYIYFVLYLPRLQKELLKLGEFCLTMIGRADIKVSKSNVAMNPCVETQASYACGLL